MRTILVLNDNSAEAENAAEFALEIAQKAGADLLILNLCKSARNKPVAEQILAAIAHNQREEYLETASLIRHLYGRVNGCVFKPVIWEIDAWEFGEKNIAELVISKSIWLMVQGMKNAGEDAAPPGAISIQAVLNRVACPLLLVPDGYTSHHFENLAYIADLRYCRWGIVKFLTDLATPYGAGLVIQHLSAQGLPPLVDSYAAQLFADEIGNKIKYDKIYFNNIKERNLVVATDVMINGLHVDLLAMANHHFHFGELFGAGIEGALPEHIHVPVMIFPS